MTTHCKLPFGLVWWKPSGQQDQRLFQVIATDTRYETTEEFDNLALNQRAWVAQDRILSPRMLYFGHSQLFWTCHTLGLASEVCPEGYPDYNLTTYLDQVGTRYTQDNSWHQILEQYTALSLSRPREDKLIALGGLAERMAGILEDEYVAGLFHRTLIDGLCFLLPTPTRASRRSQYCEHLPGPSWSWASLNHGCVWAHPLQKPMYLAMLEGYSVCLEDDSNPFGAVRSASLQILGRLISLNARQDPTPASDLSWAIYVDQGRPHCAYFDDPAKQDRALQPWVLLLLRWSSGY